MVRHDFRGPLQTIRNASYLIEKNPNSYEKMVPIINNTIDHMVRIIEDLVYTENISNSEKLELNFNTLIKQVLSQLIVQRNIQVEKNLYPGSLVGSFDKIKIQRMLDNLIRNAIEAMPNGGKLTISTGRDDSEIVVSVQDTGTGIEDISKVFVPFHTTKINGMGLGLGSVKQTVEAHNGANKS